MINGTNLEVGRQRTSGQRDNGFRLVSEKSVEDASVDVVLALKLAHGNGVESAEDGKLVRVRKPDPEKRSSVPGKFRVP